MAGPLFHRSRVLSPRSHCTSLPTRIPAIHPSSTGSQGQQPIVRRSIKGVRKGDLDNVEDELVEMYLGYLYHDW